MCNHCEYGHQCKDCIHSAKRRNKKTGLDTSDMKAYKREYMRRRRAEQLRVEMMAAGVA